MVQRAIGRVRKDKMVKDELSARVWQDYPGRGTGEAGRGIVITALVLAKAFTYKLRCKLG